MRFKLFYYQAIGIKKNKNEKRTGKVVYGKMRKTNFHFAVS